jgi:hypothetical protein
MIANKTNNVTQCAPPNWHIVHCNHKIQNHVLTGAHYWIHISPAYHCKKAVVLCANNIFFQRDHAQTLFAMVPSAVCLLNYLPHLILCLFSPSISLSDVCNSHCHRSRWLWRILSVGHWNSKMLDKRLHGCLLLLVFLLANASGTCDVAFSMSPFPFLSHFRFLIIEIPKVPEKSVEQQLWL